MVLARGQRLLSLEQTRFRGMRDNLDPSTSEADLCHLIRNAYPSDHGKKAGVLGRPGFYRMGVSGVEQGGTGATRRVQAFGQFTKLDGTEITFRVCGGRLDTYNWSTDAWTNVALVGVSLPTAAKVYFIIFADKVVFQPNDGTNKPFTWDGATTFVSLTNCPLLWGPLTVYYAKLFGVKYAVRNEIVWSEENDPTTGYEAGGFNNAWQIIQTDQEAIYLLVASNEALYYFRERSCGYVLGRVTPDFQSTGSRNGVSETIGTKSPAAAVVHEREVYFLDADARPWVLSFGGGLKALWEDLTETSRRIPKEHLGDAEGADYTPLDFALIGYRGPGGSALDHIIVIDTVTKSIGGLWDGFSFQCLGMVKDGDGAPRLLHGSPNGYCSVHGNPGELDTLNDENHADDGGTLAIYHEIKGPALGYDTKEEKQFTQLDLACMLLTDQGGITVDLETPYGFSDSLSEDVAGAFATWDEDDWDEGPWPADALERHVTFGLNDLGRWARPRVRHQELNEQFSITGWALSGVPAGTGPLVF